MNKIADPELETILRQYLESQDTGSLPDRTVLLAENPEYIEELTAFFETSDQVQDCKSWWVTPSKTLTIPTDAIVGYEILHELGRGGMGVVYKAIQTQLRRTVAIKLLRVSDSAISNRLLAEARAAARLDHPGIVPIFDVSQQDRQPFLAMAYVEGETLDALAARGPVPSKQAAQIVRDIALAVQHAHEHGIIHRDLKPANILITPDGRPKVTDFGLAKRSGEETLSAEGQVLGTPSYMPPEFAAGKAVEAGPTSDVYGIGGIFYRLLTGLAPFSGDTPLETIRRVASDDPVSPRKVNPDIHRAAEAICLRCLEKDPQHRYASAAELAADLDRYLAGEVPLAEQVGWRERLNRKLQRAIDLDRERTRSGLYLFTAAMFLMMHLVFWLVTREATSPVVFWSSYLTTMLMTSGLPLLLGTRLSRLDLHEREILVFWIAIVAGQLVVFANHCPISGVTNSEAVYSCFPSFTAIYGVVFYALGRLFWGRFYLISLFSFAIALVQTRFNAFAPLIYGVWMAIVFAFIARHLHRVTRSTINLRKPG